MAALKNLEERRRRPPSVMISISDISTCLGICLSLHGYAQVSGRNGGQFINLYRAVDKFGRTLDVMLPKRRNKAAATKFFARALNVNGLPRKIVIDRNGANTAGINAINRMLKSIGCPIPIALVRIKYFNNIVKQDHRTINKRIRPMLGFKSFVSASATLGGIKFANMIRKVRLTPGLCPFAQFAALAAWKEEIRAILLLNKETCDKTPLGAAG